MIRGVITLKGILDPSQIQSKNKNCWDASVQQTLPLILPAFSCDIIINHTFDNILSLSVSPHFQTLFVKPGQFTASLENANFFFCTLFT